MLKKMALAMVVFMGFGAAAQTTKAKTKSSVRSVTSSGKSSISKVSVAPSRTGRPFRLLPTAGITYMDIGGFDQGRADQGIIAGGLIEMPMGPLVLQSGLSYMQAGTRFSENGVAVSVLLDYIMVHAHAKMMIPNSRIYGIAGLSPMVNLHSTVKASNGRQSSAGKVSNVRDMDVLAKVGVGFEVPLNVNAMRVGGEASYNHGLMDIRTGPGSFHNQGTMFTGFLSL